MLTTDIIELNTHLPETYQGMRLDQALAKCFPEHSRTRLAHWIKQGNVQVNSICCAEPKMKVNGGETIIVQAQLHPVQESVAQNIPLNIIFEDEAIIVINKPAGLVVHPAAGNPSGTLLNALLHHAPALSHLPRAGIIHRLDKDTTGLMVIAKTLTAHTVLVAALQQREIKREYCALVAGEMISGSTVNMPIGRHLTQRIKMAVIASGKPAITHYRCHTRYQGFTLLDVQLETGRTHQIRVHLSHSGFPIVGDALYGWRLRFPAKASIETQQALSAFKRQALHAKRLSLHHPISREWLTWEASLPEDMTNLLSCLR